MTTTEQRPTDPERVAPGPSSSVSTRPPVRPDGSSVAARTRIVAWIVVATGLVLLAVVLTIRSAVVADVERDSNDNVDQELAEFRAFASEATDPETGRAFASGARLLEVHLQREFPGRGEVLFGFDLSSGSPGAGAAIIQDLDDPFGLTSADDQLRELATGNAESGVGELDGQPFRWGRAQVLDTAGEPSAVFVVTEFLTPALDEAAATVRLVIWVCLGGLVLTGLMAFAVAGAILAPVRSVRRAAASITGRDLGRRIEVRGRDDVAAMALTFNQMLDRLETSYRAQHRFARAADHHLRSHLDVLADPATSPECRARAAARLGAVLDDVTLLTASQLPDFARQQGVSLRDALDHVSTAAAATTPHHSWHSEVTVTGTAEVDLDLVTTAVCDLAANAADQQPDGVPLVLGASSDPESWSVWVRDQGPGLDDTEARDVFGRLSDLDADVDPGPGSGLGLAVVRSVADAHEGTAWVESEPGRGARFGLTLPRVPPVALLEQRQPDDD